MDVPEVRAMEEIVIDVGQCARCHGDHMNVRFKRLRVQDERYSHWAPCPNNGDPIMLAVVPDKPNGA